MRMKKIIVLCFVLVGALLANAQMIQLSSLNLDGNYIQHLDHDKTVTVSKVPKWYRTSKPWDGGQGLWLFKYITEDYNWIKIEARDFSSDSYYSLSKDSSGNVWIVYTSYRSTSPQLFAILDCDIKTIEDVVGDYWVSWKLIDGTRDIYPILHKE